jgi:hypothetical protein
VRHAREEGLERLAVGRFGRQRQRPGAAAVEGAVRGDETGRPVRRASLIAASIDSVPELREEDRGTRRGRFSGAQERLGELDLGAGGEEVGDVDDLPNLLGDRADELGWLWPSALTAMPAEQVEIALAVDVPDVGSPRRGRRRALGCRIRPARRVS